MTAWNKCKRVGQKYAFIFEEIWRIRIRLEIENKLEQLILFNLAIDSKLRSCDLLNLKVRDISSASLIHQSRAMIEQQKTHKEFQFKITPKTPQCMSRWIYLKELISSDFLFPSPRKLGRHNCYHFYANIVNSL
jgi:hypothetical protein